MWRAKHCGKESYFTLHLYSFIFFSAQRTYQQYNMYFPKPSLNSNFLEVLKFCFFWGYRWSWWCFVLLKIMHKYHRIILQRALENEAKNTQLALLQEQGSPTYLLPNPVKVQSYHTAFGTCHHMALHGTM